MNSHDLIRWARYCWFISTVPGRTPMEFAAFRDIYLNGNPRVWKR